MTIQLMTSSFPECCGINIVSSFYQKEDGGYAQKDIDAAKAYLTNKERFRGGNLTLVALNEVQAEVFDTLLSDCGFFMLAGPFTNLNSGNNIFLYLRCEHDAFYHTRDEADEWNYSKNHGHTSEFVKALPVWSKKLHSMWKGE